MSLLKRSLLDILPTIPLWLFVISIPLREHKPFKQIIHVYYIMGKVFIEPVFFIMNKILREER